MKHDLHHSLHIYLKQHVLSSDCYRKGQQTEYTCLFVKKQKQNCNSFSYFFFSLFSLLIAWRDTYIFNYEIYHICKSKLKCTHIIEK